MGKDDAGRDQFWRIGGTFTDSNPGATGSGLPGEYLSGIRGSTDVDYLVNIDRTPGR